jgi:hypothetical protein
MRSCDEFTFPAIRFCDLDFYLMRSTVYVAIKGYIKLGETGETNW